MVDITAIAGAMNSIKIIKDLTETMVGLRDASAFQQKRLELQGAMINLQNSVFSVNEERTALIETIRDLEQKIADMKTWETEKQRYQMQSIGRMTIAYALKSAMSNGEPAHWLCAGCYTDGKKGFLHTSNAPRSGLYRDGGPWGCTACRSVYSVPFGTFPTYVEEEETHAS